MPERNVKVILVDDDNALRNTMADILSAVGIEVDPACDAPAAYALLDQRRYDVAIVDMVLPGPSGVDVIRRIKRTAPGTRIIICTAYYSFFNCDLLIQAELLGVEATVRKPVDPLALAALVKDLASRVSGERPQAPDSKAPEELAKL
jgi:DNA-binding response OmpR family regulator